MAWGYFSGKYHNLYSEVFKEKMSKQKLNIRYAVHDDYRKLTKFSIEQFLSLMSLR
jgi:hypothetical protein